MSIDPNRVIGRGHGTAGETWELTAAGTSADLLTMLEITRPDGHRHGAGMGGAALPPGQRLNLFVGSADDFPRQLVLRVGAEVRGVVVMLSDSTREDLVLFGDPDELGCRVAALAYPDHLDVHRIDLYDAQGDRVGDTITP